MPEVVPEVTVGPVSGVRIKPSTVISESDQMIADAAVQQLATTMMAYSSARGTD